MRACFELPEVKDPDSSLFTELMDCFLDGDIYVFLLDIRETEMANRVAEIRASGSVIEVMEKLQSTVLMSFPIVYEEGVVDYATGVMIANGTKKHDKDATYHIRNGRFEVEKSEAKELTRIVFKEGVTIIGRDSFAENSVLETVEFPKSLLVSEDHAFWGCIKVKTVVYKGSVSDWCNIEFKHTFYCASNPVEYAQQLIIDDKIVVDLNIPEGVTKIGDYAFSRYKALKSVVLPSTLKEIGVYAFNECEQLHRTEFKGNINEWCNINIGLHGSPTCHSKNLYINNHDISEINVFNSVSKINDYAFEGCGNLCKVTLPDDIKEIGMYAFRNCVRLSIINIPNSVKKIWSSAFENCKSLTIVTIPESAEYIDNHAFDGCEKIKLRIPRKWLSSILRDWYRNKPFETY